MRLALSKGPNRVGVSHTHLRTETDPVSEMFSSFWNTGQWTKSETLVSLSVIHYRQNPVFFFFSSSLLGVSPSWLFVLGINVRNYESYRQLVRLHERVDMRIARRLPTQESATPKKCRHLSLSQVGLKPRHQCSSAQEQYRA
jgi:hypothetical protein